MNEADTHLAERALAAQEAGRTAEAEALWRHLLAVNRDDIPANFHLGRLLAGRNLLDEAARCFAHVLDRVPHSAEAAGNLGVIRQRQHRLDEAVELYRRALATQPGLGAVRNNLASALQELGRADEAVELYRELAASDDPRLAANYLTAINLAPGTPAESLVAARTWAQRFADPLTPPRARIKPDKARPLRVGYVASNTMRRHTLAMTWLPLLEAHDRAAVESVVYSDLPESQEDDVTALARNAAAQWHRTGDLEDAALAERIRRDRIDILVDGLGFAEGTRLLVFARRPAPVQVHFPPMSTTGMQAMDYVIGDQHLIPNGAETHFTETVWRLPCGFLYAPLSPLPPADLPGERRASPITFGSFNRFNKIGPAVISAWAKILRTVPAARLLLKTGGVLTPEMAARCRQQFADEGVAHERLEFRGRSTDTEHFQHLQDVDILLDTFPHGGVLTTCDALAMGVPVVTLAGARILERYGAALLTATGYPDGIARSLEDYVAKAADLAARCDSLRANRVTLAERMKTSPLCDAVAFARSVEGAYRAMWRNCQAAAG